MQLLTSNQQNLEMLTEKQKKETIVSLTFFSGKTFQIKFSVAKLYIAIN